MCDIYCYICMYINIYMIYTAIYDSAIKKAKYGVLPRVQKAAPHITLQGKQILASISRLSVCSA